MLENLINTCPDPDDVPRAKLAIADAWYAQGTFKQAEVEYRDFITFFPNRPEVAQAQLKIEAIHKKESELVNLCVSSPEERRETLRRSPVCTSHLLSFPHAVATVRISANLRVRPDVRSETGQFHDCGRLWARDLRLDFRASRRNKP